MFIYSFVIWDHYVFDEHPGDSLLVRLVSANEAENILIIISLAICLRGVNLKDYGCVKCTSVPVVNWCLFLLAVLKHMNDNAGECIIFFA